MDSDNSNKRTFGEAEMDDDVGDAAVDKSVRYHHEILLPGGQTTTNYTHTEIPRPSLNQIQAMPDKVRIQGLNFIVFSCAAQGMSQVTSTDQCAVKIRGAFNTVEEANQHAQRLQEDDPYFDIYVASMYEWFVVPPKTDMCEEVHLPNKTIEDIMNNELKYRHSLASGLEDRIQDAKDKLNEQDRMLQD